jgi:hypothetical protein
MHDNLDAQRERMENEGGGAGSFTKKETSVTSLPVLKEPSMPGVGTVAGAGRGLIIFTRPSGRALRGGPRARLSPKAKASGDPAPAVPGSTGGV